MASSKGGSDEEKSPTHLEVSRGDPLHPGYYDKDGMRVDGDSDDHDHEPPVGALNSLEFPIHPQKNEKCLSSVETKTKQITNFWVR